jgi:hypothetical protein
MTLRCIGNRGIMIEDNPLMRELFFISPFLAFIVKMGVITLCCVLCYLVKDKLIIKIATWGLLILYALVAINHIYLNIM